MHLWSIMYVHMLFRYCLVPVTDSGHSYYSPRSRIPDSLLHEAGRFLSAMDIQTENSFSEFWPRLKNPTVDDNFDTATPALMFERLLNRLEVQLELSGMRSSIATMAFKCR